MTDETDVEESPKRIISIILRDVVIDLEKILEYHSRPTFEVSLLQTKVIDRLVYLMEVLHTNISVSSHLYSLYGLWLINVHSLKNIKSVVEDMKQIRTLFVDYRPVHPLEVDYDKH